LQQPGAQASTGRMIWANGLLPPASRADYLLTSRPHKNERLPQSRKKTLQYIISLV